MHSDAAEGLRDTDIRSAAAVEGKYCSVKKQDLGVALNAVAADSVGYLWVSEDSSPLRRGAAGGKVRRGK